MVNILICCVGNDIHKLYFELNIPSKEEKSWKKVSEMPTNKCEICVNKNISMQFSMLIHIVNCHLTFDP